MAAATAVDRTGGEEKEVSYDAQDGGGNEEEKTKETTKGKLDSMLTHTFYYLAQVRGVCLETGAEGAGG